MILGDAYIFKDNATAAIRFEQGSKQQPFIEHLFEKFKTYTFMEQLRPRYKKNENNELIVCSCAFKTLTFPCFTELYSLFHITQTTTVTENSSLLRRQTFPTKQIPVN